MHTLAALKSIKDPWACIQDRHLFEKALFGEIQ